MSDYGFTPGPWDLQNMTVFALDEHGRVNRFCANVQGGYVNGGERRAFGDKVIRTADDELRANARLIAASPTLLEAVIAAEDYFATLPADDAAHSLYLQMNAAITLATGKDA